MSCCMSRSEISYGGVSGVDVELKELKLGHDKELGYYLSAKYRVENERSVREIDIPRIMLGVKPDFVAIRQEYDQWSTVRADIGFGFRPLGSIDLGNGIKPKYIEHIIEEKTHEMTLDEIEKRLGYKVKIVNK